MHVMVLIYGHFFSILERKRGIFRYDAYLTAAKLSIQRGVWGHACIIWSFIGETLGGNKPRSVWSGDMANLRYDDDDETLHMGAGEFCIGGFSEER